MTIENFLVGISSKLSKELQNIKVLTFFKFNLRIIRVTFFIDIYYLDLLSI